MTSRTSRLCLWPKPVTSVTDGARSRFCCIEMQPSKWWKLNVIKDQTSYDDQVSLLIIVLAGTIRKTNSADIPKTESSFCRLTDEQRKDVNRNSYYGTGLDTAIASIQSWYLQSFQMVKKLPLFGHGKMLQLLRARALVAMFQRQGNQNSVSSKRRPDENVTLLNSIPSGNDLSQNIGIQVASQFLPYHFVWR